MTRKTGWLGAALLAAACTPGITKPSTAGLDELLLSAVEQQRVPLVVARVATAEGAEYEGAFGAARDGIFRIASMTKPITSVAVMQLVEAGKVDLDAPAATYEPELGTVQVLEGGALRPPRTPITVRQLLTHTSGFGYEFLNRDLYEAVAKGELPSVGAGGDGFLEAPLLFDPGTRWEYGISADWLGRLVERVSGQSLEAYFRDNVFQPLGMEDTFFDVPLEKQSRLVRLFQRGEDGGLVEQPPAPTEPVEFFSGGGGLHSTAKDYLTFTRAILAGGQLGSGRILQPETVALMGQNQIGGLEVAFSRSVMPQLMSETAALPGQPDKFGFGFALNSRPIDDGRGANTLSWAGVHNTYFWIDRDRGVCAVLLTQVLPFSDRAVQALVEDFDQAVYAWRAAQAR